MSLTDPRTFLHIPQTYETEEGNFDHFDRNFDRFDRKIPKISAYVRDLRTPIGGNFLYHVVRGICAMPNSDKPIRLLA